MHKIKILKLTVTVRNKIEQYYIYKPTNILAATLFYYIHVLAMKWLALNYSCNGAESKLSSIYICILLLFLKIVNGRFVFSKSNIHCLNNHSIKEMDTGIQNYS